VSVIVCSYNAGATLRSCLESLGKIDYPKFEIVLVDDGSTDNTAQIAAGFPNVRYVHQPNRGLSVARNTGAAAARGEVFAYTDADCMADVDWLYYLIGTLTNGDFAGVGGPNVPPPAKTWIQACVAAAPGGPSHVLLTDTVAEHIPGCNMAFWRWAFENVGGFDPEYHAAGDDVDFCWRLQQGGGVIAFSPTAIVWHHRRFTLRAFRKQQEGYGEAESLLRFKHLVFFGPTGTAKWRGQIYGTPRFDTIHSRLLVMLLAFAQPLVRGWSRYFTWLHFKRTPGSVIAQHEKLPPGKKIGRSWGRLAYWNEEGKDRHSLLREIFTLLNQENWRYSIDTGWQEWDIQIYGNFWWSIILRTVTEYHGGGKCLTRVQLRYRYVTTTLIVNLIVLTLFI